MDLLYLDSLHNTRAKEGIILIFLLSGKQWVIFVCILADTAGAGRPVGLAIIVECSERYSIQ